MGLSVGSETGDGCDFSLLVVNQYKRAVCADISYPVITATGKKERYQLTCRDSCKSQVAKTVYCEKRYCT